VTASARCISTRLLPLATVLFSFACFLTRAAIAQPLTVLDIQLCNQANLPERTSIQTISLRAKDRIGAITTSRSKIYWRKFDDGLSRLMMRFYEPPDLRGSAYLLIETKKRNDMFIYLSELGRVKRVTSRMTSSSMFGTDFSYEEFERLQGMAQDSPTTRLADRVVDGRPAYVLEIRPTEESQSAYKRILSFIDQEKCTLNRSEFYERGDDPRKVLSADVSQITREATGIWVARKYIMRDLRDQTETAMVIESLRIGEDISRKMFSERELLSGGR
jgi:hypothetical protein